MSEGRRDVDPWDLLPTGDLSFFDPLRPVREHFASIEQYSEGAATDDDEWGW